MVGGGQIYQFISTENCSDLNEWPALAMFRNGLMVSFTEDVQAATEKQLNDWLTAESTLKIIGVIDEVKLSDKTSAFI